MKQPHLEIMSDENAPIVKGRCSSCVDVTFSISQTAESPLALIHGMFSEHFKKVHMHEDASQAAARIVREATDGK